MANGQAGVDYLSDAQIRVAAETLGLERSVLWTPNLFAAQPGFGAGALLMGGNEITDALRQAGAGDGRRRLAIDWYGGFSTQNEREYDGVEMKTAGSPPLSSQFTFVTNPAPAYNTYMVQVDVHDADVFNATSGERGLFRWSPNDMLDGTSFFFRWSVLFPIGYQHPSQWGIFAEHHEISTRFGQAPFVYRTTPALGLQLRLHSGTFPDAASALAGSGDTSDRTIDLAPSIYAGQRIDFLEYVDWSQEAKGRIVVWMRVGGGSYVPVVDLAGIQTIPTITGDPTPGTVNFLLGFYRNHETFTSTIYVGDAARGQSFADMQSLSVPGNGGADSSVGIYRTTLNEIENSIFKTNATGYGTITTATNARQTSGGLFPPNGPCLKITTTGTGSGRQFLTRNSGARYPVAADSTRTIMFYVKRGAGNRRSKIGIEEYNAGGSLVRTQFFGPPSGVGWEPPPADRYSVRWASFTVGPTTTEVRPFLTYESAGGNIGDELYIAGVSMTRDPIPLPLVVTDGAAATRGPGRIRMKSSYVSAKKGALFFRVRPDWRSVPAPAIYGNLGLPATYQAHLFYWQRVGDTSTYLRCFYANAAWTLELSVAGVVESVALPDRFADGRAVSILADWSGGMLRLERETTVYLGRAGASATRTLALPTDMDEWIELGSHNPVGGEDHLFQGAFLHVDAYRHDLTDSDRALIFQADDADLPLTLAARPLFPTAIWPADTSLIYEQRASDLLVGGDIGYSQGYALPDDLVHLTGIFNGTTALEPLSDADLLAFLSGGSSAYTGPLGYAIVGRFLYLAPVPSAPLALTLTYWARPVPYLEDADLELVGEEARLTEDLVEANEFLDGGQPEVGISEVTRVEGDMLRLRRANRGRKGQRDRLLVQGVDQWL